jgi:hypothetical protein
MKNKDLYGLINIFNKWSTYNNKNFSYVLSKNREILNTSIETLNRMIITPSDYEKRRLEICNKYSDEVKNEKFIITDNNKFNKEMDKLDFNYMMANKILNLETNVIFYKIDINDLPENLSEKELNEISFMIK